MATAVLLTLLAIEPFVTASGGVSTLSADGGTSFNGAAVASLYRPENGPALQIGGGVHLNDWIGAQVSYVWNRNAVELNGIRDSSFFAWPQRVRQDAVVGDAILYFRPLTSRLRPYLSAGIAAVRFDRAPSGEANRSGNIPLPSATAVTWLPGMRVAVGIDIMVRNGWGFRYSFGETLTKNPISRSLTPPPPRNLMNFQSQFGFVKYF